MSNDKKDDRLLTREEYEEFNIQHTLESYRKLLIDLNNRLEEIEKEVYGKQRNNSKRD